MSSLQVLVIYAANYAANYAGNYGGIMRELWGELCGAFWEICPIETSTQKCKKQRLPFHKILLCALCMHMFRAVAWQHWSFEKLVRNAI